MCTQDSLVPRPRPAFHTESDGKLGGARERGYTHDWYSIKKHILTLILQNGTELLHGNTNGLLDLYTAVDNIS